jgi:hypothetical protein
MADPAYKGLPCPKCHVFDDVTILPGKIMPEGFIYRDTRIFHTEMDWEDEEDLKNG